VYKSLIRFRAWLVRIIDKLKNDPRTFSAKEIVAYKRLIRFRAWLVRIIDKLKNDPRTYIVTAGVAVTELFLWAIIVKSTGADPFDKPYPLIPSISMWWIKLVGLIILFVGSMVFYTILSFKKNK